MQEKVKEGKMGIFHKVARKGDIEVGQGIVAETQGVPLAIFNVGGSFYAIHNLCPHRGAPLGEGELSGSEVTCPWHAWQFDVKTGQNLDNPDSKVKTYPVKVEGDDIFVELQS